MKRQGSVKGVVGKLSSGMMDDAQTVKGVFDEFKVDVPDTKARRASRTFDEQELEILRPDYGSAVDTIINKKR